ncbi:hypothetical protein [Solicola gregarius]|uniref:Uncharacterized protein n=1 Tax=Solicola gregarius TaxID=2908642 RepID=A0AA46TGN9_9ACTN|nr:hypothetical protein [Solicola gregarius]UYM04930.1 hypothetical protein L0C25_20780 [Solicola gregarius]
MHDHLVSYLRSALSNAADGSYTFQLLSDEEIAAIDREVESDLSLQPWIDANNLNVRECARFGERSLFLRGLLEPSDEATDDGIRLRASDALQLVADVRRLCDAHLMARSAHGGVRTGRYLTVQSRAGAFEESVDAEGMHVFTACTHGVAVERLAEWALPIVSHAGVPVNGRIPVERWNTWVINELGVSARQVEVLLFLPDATGAIGAESWLVAHANGIGVIAFPDGGQQLRISAITRERLSELILDRVAGALPLEP